ncbi:hypothetical protein VNO78_03319 [Psophocarpus tetragonolobus]|uniref:Uncharacterized protein n=1 Tax=Psophocarpus tetragonolobus TaxID=3891 RepID=A0AAN9T0D1_PSOTE
MQPGPLNMPNFLAFPAYLPAILSHPTVAVKTRQMDGIVNLVDEHMRSNQEAFIDPRLLIVYNDAKYELEKFDVIIGNLPDPLESEPGSTHLCTKSFCGVLSNLSSRTMVSLLLATLGKRLSFFTDKNVNVGFVCKHCGCNYA